MKKLILHLGFHKTATSSIQKTLSNNRSFLELQGYFYPVFYSGKREYSNHSVPFYSVFSKDPTSYHMNIRTGDSNNIKAVNERYAKQIDEVLSMDNDIIISGEGISSLDSSSLLALKDKVLEAGFSIFVYCSVRRPYSYLCSAYQERIKNGMSDLKTVAFFSKIKDVYKIKSVFDEVFFYNFESDCKFGCPVKAFLSRIGVNPLGIDIVRENEGLGNVSTRVLGHLNIYHPIMKNGTLNPSARKKTIGSIESSKFLLSADELLIVKEDLDKENLMLKECLGEEFCDKEYLVSENLNLDEEISNKIIDKYYEPHTIRSLMKFISNNSEFDISLLVERFGKNADVLREIALLVEAYDINLALSCMEKAGAIRPNGPFISRKINQYKKLVCLHG